MAKPKDDAEYLYNIPKLNIVFALMSILFLVSVVWMLADDYIREWRVYQRAFNRIEIARTQSLLADERAALDSSRISELEAQIETAKELLEQKDSEINTAREELNSLENDLYGVNQLYQFAKSEYDAIKYRYEVEVIEERHDEATLSRAEMEKYGAEMAERNLEREKISEAIDNVNGVIDGLTAEQEKSTDELRDLKTEVEKLENKLAQISPSFTNTFRNLPMLDFINPSEEIKQVVLADLHVDLNFMSVPRVDRCMTCHLAIDEPGFEDESQPFGSHPRLDLFLTRNSPHPLSRYGCTTCHEGLGRSVTFKDTYHTPENNEQAEEWESKYGWEEPHHWDTPMYKKSKTQAACYKCHKTQAEVVGADVLNSGISLIKRLGCFGCHKIEGFNDIRKVGPDLRRISSKVSREWAYRWVRNPKHFQSKTRMPRIFGLLNSSSKEELERNDVQIKALVAYLFENSTSMEYDGYPVSGNAARGKQLVENLGCLGCHKIGDAYPDTGSELVSRREFGPNLAGLGSKTNRRWLFHWLKNPKEYFPGTVMPRMRLSDEEAADIVEYILSMKNVEFDESAELMENNEILDELSLEYLKRTMTADQANHELGEMSVSEKNVYLGEYLVRRYGCFGCHEIGGFEEAQQIGTELTEEGSKLLSRFDFGFVDIPHTREAWLFTKLKTPRIFDSDKVKTFDEKLKMPNFGLSVEETNAVLTALLGFTKEKISNSRMRSLDAHEQAVHQGLKLIQERNCRGCHVIDGRGGDIKPVVGNVMVAEGRTEEEAVIFIPPVLDGEGAKVQPDWLFRFVKDPVTIRPWLRMRMPTFYLSDEDALIIEQYFTHASKQRFPYRYIEKPPLSEEMIAVAKALLSPDYFACFSCHQQGTVKPEGPITNWAPDLALANERLRHEWIPKWLKNPQELQPGTRMPMFFDPEYYDESGPDDILDGDEDLQIEVMTEYILSLGEKN